MHRLQVVGVPRRVAQGLAHLPDAAGQGRLANGRLGPHRVHERGFGDQLARVGHQAAQHGKGFGGQRPCLLAAPQAFIAHVQAKRRKLDHGREGHRKTFPRTFQELSKDLPPIAR